MSSPQIVSTVARELSLSPQQVASTLALFAEGNTLPFIARYRKEATAGLDEVQLSDVRDRAQYLAELDERRTPILKSIDDQGKLDDALRSAIDNTATKQALEDLYLPCRPKRRNRATIARERGRATRRAALGPHHERRRPSTRSPTTNRCRKGRSRAPAALAGARDILAARPPRRL